MKYMTIFANSNYFSSVSAISMKLANVLLTLCPTLVYRLLHSNSVNNVTMLNYLWIHKTQNIVPPYKPHTQADALHWHAYTHAHIHTPSSDTHTPGARTRTYARTQPGLKAELKGHHISPNRAGDALLDCSMCPLTLEVRPRHTYACCWLHRNSQRVTLLHAVLGVEGAALLEDVHLWPLPSWCNHRWALSTIEST